MRFKGFILLFFASLTSQGQNINPFYIGHSLINHTVPYMVQELAKSAGINSQYGKQIMNGAPLRLNYDEPNGAEGTPYTKAFPAGNFNTLVIAEAVPLQNHLTWNDTYGFANKLYTYAKNNNKGQAVRYFIYESWHCIYSGIPNSNANFPNGCWYDQTANSTVLWHPRLQKDFSLWSGIVNYVREKNPSDKQIWMVPVGQALYQLTAQIAAGKLPGISNFKDLFADDIHLNNTGNYFAACVMFATIYGKSPVGLSSNFKDEYGNTFSKMPTSAQAAIMQQAAWNTVTGLSEWTGVSTIITANITEQPAPFFSIFPNPANDLITLKTNNEESSLNIQIFNAKGQVFFKSIVKGSITINVSQWPSGQYFVHTKDLPAQIQKFIKL